MTTAEKLRFALDTVATSAMAIAAGVLIWFLLSNGTAATASKGTTSAIEDIKGLQTTRTEWTLGSAGAKVAVIEFSDMQCPFCGRYARETYPQLNNDLIKTGQVEYVFRHFPLEAIHSLALKAGEALECAGEQRHYWEMRDRLFANQDTLTLDALRDHASALNLDSVKFGTCMDGSTLSKIKADQAEGERLGVRATPTLFLGKVQPGGAIVLVKKIPGASTYSTLRAEIRKLM